MHWESVPLPPVKVPCFLGTEEMLKMDQGSTGLVNPCLSEPTEPWRGGMGAEEATPKVATDLA